MSTLIELTNEARALYDRMTDMGIEDQAALDTIEAETDLIPKMQDYGHVMRRMNLEDDLIAAEIARLQGIRKVRANRLQNLKDRLLYAMNAVGMQKIEHPLFTLSVRNNPESVEVFDERQVPEDYFKVKKELSKTAIKDAIKAGADVPGAKLTRTQSLTLK